jgi:hypothetical protein
MFVYPLQVCEKNIIISPPAPVALAAGVAKTVISDQSQAKNPAPNAQLAQRLIQAIGGDIYVAFGVGDSDDDAGVAGSVNNAVFHCFIQNGQQRDISNDRGRVVCWCATAGCVVAVELRWRNLNVTGAQTLV